MRQNTKRFTSSLLAFVLLIAAAFMYFDLVVPAYGDLQGLRAQEGSLAAFVNNQQIAVQKVQQLITTYQNQTDLQNTVSQALPPSPDISGALLQLNGIAQMSGLAAQQFAVTQVLPTQTKSQTPSATAASEGPLGQLASPVGTLVIRAQLIGSYEGLKNFLSKVENNVRVFNVTNYTIHPVTQSTPGHPTTDSFSIDLTLATYYQGQIIATTQ